MNLVLRRIFSSRILSLEQEGEMYTTLFCSATGMLASITDEAAAWMMTGGFSTARSFCMAAVPSLGKAWSSS
jgi:hypothetical protein